MVATTFDALYVARELKAAGVEAAQAEAIAEGIRQAAIADRAELATKGDVAGVDAKVASVRTEVASVRTEVASVRTEVANLRSEMRWIFGFMAALILAMAGKLFGVY